MSNYSNAAQELDSFVPLLKNVALIAAMNEGSAAIRALQKIVDANRRDLRKLQALEASTKDDEEFGKEARNLLTNADG